VVSAAPLIETQVMATFRGAATGAVVRGVRPDDLAKDSIVAQHIIEGKLADFKGTDTVLIGSRMAQNYGVFVGDSITLVSPKGNVTVFGTVPRTRAFKVVGIFSVGMFEYDSHFIYMPLEAAQSFFQMANAASAVEVRLTNPDLAVEMRGPVSRAASAAGVPVRTSTWQQANSSFFTAVEVERNVMFLILTLIIVVAAFNVISGLIMLVKDKGRDIAILRTMGATRGMIMRIFLLAGASVGVVGTLLGFVLGLVFCENIERIREFIQMLTGTNLFSPEIYFLSQLPAKVDAGEVATVVIMSLVLSFLATLYPSWRAARLDPVEALRYE
jgi:lipoprotein-releasing system permease protein